MAPPAHDYGTGGISTGPIHAEALRGDGRVTRFWLLLLAREPFLGERQAAAMLDGSIVCPRWFQCRRTAQTVGVCALSAVNP